MTLKQNTSGIPKYELLHQKIYHDIQRGLYGVGDQIPPERILAKEAGVAHMTARQAVQKLVDAGILVREHGRGTFVIRTNKKDSSTPSSQALAILSPGGANTPPSVVYGVQHGVHDYATRYGYDMQVYYYPSTKAFREVIQRCVKHPPSGLIIWYQDLPSNRLALEELNSHDIPFVLLDSYPGDPGLNYPAVVTENILASKSMVKHLHALGHRRIIYITGHREFSSTENRRKGFEQAINDFGLSESSVFRLPHPEGKNDIVGILRYLLKEHAPTALFAYKDFVAASFLKALKTIGVKVPEELTVVGFDNVDLASHTSPPLTTMAQNFYGMARTAADLLVGAASTPPTYPIRIPAKLIERDSAGPVFTPSEDHPLTS